MAANKAKKNILIATGIYPPEIGGPAQYAEILFSGLKNGGYEANVVTYGKLKKLPTGVRHVAYFLRLIPKIMSADAVVILDTFSCAVPVMCLNFFLNKKTIVRIGGDFLWEQYVERTKEMLSLSEFYSETRKYSTKEKDIFRLTKFVLRKANVVVFSTKWQRDIMSGPYEIAENKTRIIENVYENLPKRNTIPKNRIILSPSRSIFLKNKINLHAAFDILTNRFSDIVLDEKNSNHEKLMERLKESYCVVVPSFSEVSPNIVLDALSRGVPVVVTADCGMKERLDDMVVWVDPKNPQSIADGVEELLDAAKYSEYMARISKFSFVHAKEDIIREFEDIFKKL